MAPYRHRGTFGWFLAIVFIGLFVCVLYLWAWKPSEEVDGFESFLIVWCITCMLGVIARYTYLAYRYVVRIPYRLGARREIDRFVDNINNGIDIQSRDPIFLYLRPFGLDHKMYDVDPNLHASRKAQRIRDALKPHWADLVPYVGWMIPRSRYDTYIGDQFEKRLAKKIRTRGILIGLRTPTDINDLFCYPERGGGSFWQRSPTPRDDWQKHVIALMNVAKIIYFIPYNSAGSLWELSEIVKMGFLLKTIFIWPAPSLDWRPQREHLNAELLHEIWSKIGQITEPNIDATKGCYFAYRNDKQPIWEIKPWDEEIRNLEEITDSTCRKLNGGRL
jgi:hypothetical protein